MSEMTQRRLAAIVALDVAGYSRLMGADEEGTLAALKAHRRELVDPAMQRHSGRIVSSAGDGMLVEFASVVDAVQACLAVQRAMAERNAEVVAARRIAFRIGINVGDVIVDGGDIFGDGVNVAARLEGLADPGGICVSRSVRDQIRDRLPITVRDMGEVAVKNIARPVRAFKLAIDGAAGALAPPPAAEAAAADRPSIAVLPFDNMGGDPEQEYFADGITEDIITVLSKFRTFSVAARNSTFVYKGEGIDIKQAAGELGVRYLVEGSVRKSGNRVRITAQLIDAEGGDHVWAERYDRELEDIFAVQDEITECVVAAIAPEVVTAEIQRAQRKDVSDLDT